MRGIPAIVGRAAGVAALAAGYAVAFAVILGDTWQRKEGGLPPVAPWRARLERVVVQFPFGYFPPTANILLLPFLNGLFWGIVLVYGGRWLWRRGRRDA